MSLNPDDDKKLTFKLDDLDMILLEHVFYNPKIKEDLLGYLLDVYHRAIEMIEIRYLLLVTYNSIDIKMNLMRVSSK